MKSEEFVQPEEPPKPGDDWRGTIRAGKGAVTIEVPDETLEFEADTTSNQFLEILCEDICHPIFRFHVPFEEADGVEELDGNKPTALYQCSCMETMSPDEVEQLCDKLQKAVDTVQSQEQDSTEEIEISTWEFKNGNGGIKLHGRKYAQYSTEQGSDSENSESSDDDDETRLGEFNSGVHSIKAAPTENEIRITIDHSLGGFHYNLEYHLTPNQTKKLIRNWQTQASYKQNKNAMHDKADSGDHSVARGAYSKLF